MWRVKQKNSCVRRSPMLSGWPGFSSPENTVPPSRRLALWEFAGNGNDLRELCGEVRQNEKGGIDLLDELAIGFGLVADALPFGIVAEGLPVGRGSLAAGMGKDVDEGFPFLGIVGGRPVGHVFHAVFLEEFCGVFAKAAEQVVQLAVVSVIDTKFVHSCRGRRGARLLLIRGKPGCRWEERYCGKGLKQDASFHGSDSSRDCARWAGLRTTARNRFTRQEGRDRYEADPVNPQAERSQLNTRRAH